MSAEPVPNTRFAIGHVLFMDVVGYSKLLLDEQTKSIRALNEVVQRTVQFRKADARNQLVRVPTGDGMALVFRDSPESPAHCALEIARVLQKLKSIPLRMGIHSGPVNQVTDVNNRINVAGAGINIAQRVMDCGDAGHILLSKHVAEDLEHHGRWQPLLHDLGECEAKHGLRIGLVNLYEADAGNANLPEAVRRCRKKQAANSVVVFGITIGLSAIIAGGTWYLARSLSKRDTEAKARNAPPWAHPITSSAPVSLPGTGSPASAGFILADLAAGTGRKPVAPLSLTHSSSEKMFAGTWRGTVHNSGPQSNWDTPLALTIDETEKLWGDMTGGSVFRRGKTLAYKRSTRAADGTTVQYHATLIVHDDNRTATYTTSEKRVSGKWHSSTFGKGTLEKDSP